MGGAEGGRAVEIEWGSRGAGRGGGEGGNSKCCCEVLAVRLGLQ